MKKEPTRTSPLLGRGSGVGLHAFRGVVVPESSGGVESGGEDMTAVWSEGDVGSGFRKGKRREREEEVMSGRIGFGREGEREERRDEHRY